MKKILTLVAVVGMMTGLTVQAQPVYSNIVGMIKTTVAPNSFEIVSLPFNGANGDITLGEAFGGVPDQTVIYYWNGLSYSEYTFYSEAPGWFAPGFVPSDNVVFPKGSSIWVKSPSVATGLVHSGNVPDDPAITVDFLAGFSLISVPYPVEITLADLNVSQVPDLAVIYVWNGDGYSEYTYYEQAPGWFAPGFVPSDTVSIPSGKGFWLSSSAGGSIIFNKPY